MKKIVLLLAFATLTSIPAFATSAHCEATDRLSGEKFILDFEIAESGSLMRYSQNYIFRILMHANQLYYFSILDTKYKTLATALLPGRMTSITSDGAVFYCQL